MKTNEELREFAAKWAKILKSKDPNTKEMFIAHHNVFVSEHYYPKTFIEWMLSNGLESNHTTDELYEYWKENER